MKVGTTLDHHRIVTRARDGMHNGWVVPVWNSREEWSGPQPEQCYLTVVLPGTTKGPHLHRRRSGAFTCIKGNARITVRDETGVYVRRYSGEDHKYRTVFVPPGFPALIECIGTEPAYVLNMPSPSWTKEDPDEWPVEDWNP